MPKIDYLEGRYYACIPVLLLTIDGIVNEYNNTGFAADNTDLSVWDSFVGHSTAIPTLKRIMTSSRTRTNHEPIATPFRHGILHGRDINYDNKIIAAKCWQALLSVSDWHVSKRSERSRQEAFNKEENHSFKDTLKQLDDLNRQKKELASWKPRPKNLIERIIIEQDFKDGTAEEAVAKFLNLWSKKNYGSMCDYFQNPYKYSKGEFARQAREFFQARCLKEWNIRSISDEALAVSEVVAELTFEGKVEGTITLRLIRSSFDTASEAETSKFAPVHWKLNMAMLDASLCKLLL